MNYRATIHDPVHARQPGPTEIVVYMGNYVDVANPDPARIDIRDIAHALSMINRFTGHTRRPLSVAEHSVNVSLVLPPELALAGLLHDAAEAYLGDVSSPLKRMLPEYQALEERWMEAVAAKFGVSFDSEELKQADRCALSAEFTHVMGRADLFAATPHDRQMMARMGAELMVAPSWIEAHHRFARRFTTLTGSVL